MRWRKRQPPVRSILCLLGLLFLARPAQADSLQSTPFGGRSAAMGGAGIARGDDSAMPVLNPAGVAIIPRSSIAVSASVYSASLVTIPHFNGDDTMRLTSLGLGEISQSGLSSTSILSTPTSLVGVIHLEHEGITHNLAGSITVPRTVSRRFLQSLDTSDNRLGSGGVGTFTNREDTTYILSSQRYLLGASYGVAPPGGVRFGASVLFSYAPTVWTLSHKFRSFFGNAAAVQSHVSDQSFDSYSADLTGNMGLQIDLTRAWSLGVVVQPPSFHLKGDLRSTISEQSFAGEAQRLVSSRQTGDYIDGMPLRVGAGASFHVSNLLTVALDVNYYFSLEGRVASRGNLTNAEVDVGDPPRQRTAPIDSRLPAKHFVNVAGGIDWMLLGTRKHWLRAGGFTDFNDDRAVPAGTAATDPACAAAVPDESRCIGPAHVLNFPFDRFGVTLGYGRKSGVVDSTIGVAAIFGSGSTARSLFDGEKTVYSRTDARTYDVLVFLTATVEVDEPKIKARELLKREIEELQDRIRTLEQKNP
jgi:hypothetical protein